MSIRCRNCGAENAPSTNFCSSCGAQLMYARTTANGNAFVSCPNCGANNPSTNNNCPKCGTSLRQQYGSPPPTQVLSQPSQKKKFKWWKLFTWPFICLGNCLEGCCSCCCGSCCDSGSSSKSLKQELAEEAAENVLESILGD